MRRAWGNIRRTGLLPVFAGTLGVVGVLWVVLVAAPPWFVHDRSLEGLKAQNEVRTTLLQGLGGMVLLVGAYFTYRQLHSAREGQITERYTRAIDQLGHDQLDVRLGGIYALERIARDSPDDRATIGEVLTAFVRSHAPWPPRLPGQYVATAPIDQVPELQARAADVQACLTVLGRGGFAPPAEGQSDRLDLHTVDLRHANLTSAHLERADLRDTYLERADLTGAHVEEANLAGAHLERADLGGAYLEEADLGGAYLERADLGGAHLERADLAFAHLEEAILAFAHLEEANLGGAHLERADLGGAHLERAILGGAPGASIPRRRASGGGQYRCRALGVDGPRWRAPGAGGPPRRAPGVGERCRRASGATDEHGGDRS
jgi:Pentapeptide repeats (8 copies)